MSSSPLADLTLTQVSERLDGYGSSLQGEAKDAIHALLQALESGLKGTLEDAYHLSSIDPGLGKTLSVTTFLRSWKAEGFTPASSVLIGLSRLAEIPRYLNSSGLDKEDVAILTRRPDLNALGLPEDQHDAAPVMFTTQQMIERRTRGKAFAEASEFHYHSRKRTLRIWDESLIPAEPLTLRVDELACLPSVLRRRGPEFTSRLQEFLTELWRLKDRGSVMVPEDFPELIDTIKKTIGCTSRDVLETLRRLSGRSVTMVDTGYGDMHMAGSSAPLPSDFSPVVILDASGRVRETYSVWEKEKGTLRRLPAAVKDYSNLKINLWEHAVGQEAMKAAGAPEEVVRAVAEVIDQEPEVDWLIIHYKKHPIDVRLREALKNDLGDRLNFLHWGDHHGTNAFAHCRNVVLIGQLTHGAASYPAHAVACGVLPPTRSAKLEQELKSGEYRHNLLQGLTRAHVRHSHGGSAGNCQAFVIASPNTGARKLLTSTFPGGNIEPWKPKGRKATGQAAKLIAILEEAAARGGEHKFPKKELAARLDILGPNLSKLLGHPAVTECIDRLGVNVEPRELIVRGPAFDPYVGEDAFILADLEGLSDA